MDEERKKKSSRDRVRRHRAIKADIRNAIAQRLQNQERNANPCIPEPQNIREAEDEERPPEIILQNDDVQSEIDRRSDEQSLSSAEENEERAPAGELEDENAPDESEASTMSEPEGNVIGPNEDEDEEFDEVMEIRRWAISRNIRQNALDDILRILRRRVLPQLPKSAKTLLQTEATAYNIQPMEAADDSMGEFVYFGIAKGLEACLIEALHANNGISLQINVDGVKLFNSGTKQFWPILCKVLHSPDIYEPFIVGIYSGDAKPRNPEHFLHDFVQEVNHLLAEGIVINGRQLEITIHSFICDTPARAFLKGIIGHGGYYACERCEVKGERCHQRTVYADVDARERDDLSFRLKAQPQHHKRDSPLLAVEPRINMVHQFLLDYMHLCCEGVMKKLLDYWVGGKQRNFMRRRHKLGIRQQQEISHLLVQLRRCIPLEFQRKPRILRFIADWKAVEFRFFLMYCGPIVLKGILDPELYRHFVVLHVACRMLCCNEFAFTHNALAKMYLRYFVQAMPTIYGYQSQIMNVHNLIHLADDVRNTNCTLSSISAFPFESLLGRIKKLIRNANRPMAQVCRRLNELAGVATKPRIPSSIKILKSKTNRNNDQLEIQRMRYKDFTLTTTFPNNLVLLDSGIILKITNMHCLPEDRQNIIIRGNQWNPKGSIFQNPTKSEDLKMYQLVSQPLRRIVECNIARVERKMVNLEIKPNFGRGQTKIFAIPFLH